MLTDKEKIIVQCLAEGKPQKLIAKHLSLSESGVEWYLKNMFTRYRVANSVELVAYCMGKVWVTVEKHSEKEEG